MDNGINPAVIAAINQAKQNVAQKQQQQQQAHGSKLLQMLMMLAQGADAVNTANFLKHPGTFETDPLSRPFARGGLAPMLGGAAMEDKAIGALPSAGSQNTAMGLQLLLNLLGIARTNARPIK